MTFRVDQKVVCVDASGSTCLRGDAVYDVTGTKDLPEFIRVSCCAEHAVDHDAGWFARRFRPIVRHQTEISFAHEILRKASRKETVRA